MIDHRRPEKGRSKVQGDGTLDGERSPAEQVLLWFGGVGAACLLPFALAHLLAGQQAIGWLVLAVVLLCGAPVLYVWRTHNLKLGGLGFVISYSVGLVASLYIGGAPLVYWVYPGSAAAYLFVRPRQALLLNGLVGLAVLPVLVESLDAILLARLLVSWVLTNLPVFLFASCVQSQHLALTSLVTHDPLTGVGNRRAFSQRVSELIAAGQRRSAPAALLLLDLDHFKQLNDTLGHAQGDKVLSGFAELIQGRIRLTDGLYRYGGDEFVLLLSDTLQPDALRFADQLRQQVMDKSPRLGSPFTISVGVAQLQEADTEASWLKRADQALYLAKSGGRNRIESL